MIIISFVIAYDYSHEKVLPAQTEWLIVFLVLKWKVIPANPANPPNMPTLDKHK